MACNWLMVTSSGDNNWPSEPAVWVCSPTKLKKKLTSRLTNVKTALFKLLGAHKNTTKYLATTFCEKTLLGNNLKDG